MIEKPAETSVEIAELIAHRWSGRAYDADRPVARQALVATLEAARWAPSCYGDQPWRFVVWDRHADTASWQRALDCLADGNKTWARNAPVLLLAAADSLMTRNGEPNRWGQYDTGAAAVSLCLEATRQGLMAHQMGGFDAARVRSEFDIPERYVCMAMITLGYALPLERIPEEARERELAARARRPLAACFFEGGWERPVNPA